MNISQILDGKRIWNWTTLAVGGGLGIAAVITELCGLVCAGPLGWAVLIVGGIGAMISFFLPDKNKKINEARQRLEKKLKDNIDAICKNTEKILQKCLDEIVEKRVNELCNEMQRILNVMFSLSDEQRKLAWQINYRVSDLNAKILGAVFRLTGFDGLQHHVKAVARIPGQEILLELLDGTRLPDDCKEKIQKMMGEEISLVFETNDKQLLLSRILGKDIDRKNIRIEEKIGIAHIPIEKRNLFLIRKVRLAQQLTDLLITR